MKARAWGFVLLGWVLVTAVQAQAQATSLAQAGALSSADQIDLNDPRVRARMRAAGIDPDELQSLMQAQNARPGAPTAAVTDTLFPPVVFPPTHQAERDSVLDDNAARKGKGAGLTRFGADVFRQGPEAFEPMEFGPVPPDYRIGPGDEVIVSVWGAQELNVRVPVNRDGFIQLPDLGLVSVNGQTLQSLKDHLEKRLARIYSGIRSDGQGSTFVEISLGNLRSMQVFVLGDVVNPGGYTVTATSSVLNALYHAGGPSGDGSLRNIRVLRDNKVVERVDLYDYLARGDRSHDARLEHGDVVFVPPVGSLVTLDGEVHNPAVYELTPDEKLSDLLGLAGGFRSTALLSRIQVERIIPFEERVPLEQEDRTFININLEPGSGQDAFTIDMHDGDHVTVLPIGNILRNVVKLTGTAVYKPGTFEHRTGMRVSDLVDRAGGLLGDAYMGWAHLVRTLPDKTRQLRSFNLQAALDGDPTQNLQLQQLDEVQVFSVWDIQEKRYVSIEGLVRKPGRYELLEGMTITDLVMQAGGLRESAYRSQAEVSRINPESISSQKTAEQFQVSMADELGQDSDASRFPLLENDIVFIRAIPNWSLQENVWITGEVKFPGKYSLTSKTERLSSLIDRAGGLEETAYLNGAAFHRQKDDTGRMAIDFVKALESGKRDRNKYDLVMAAGDSIHIPREPKTVKVVGQVGFPSSILFENGRGHDWYIEQAGGKLDTADGDKIRIVMANGRVRTPGWLHSPKPDAGATIVVPAKPEPKERNTLKNAAQIVSILTGAATTIYLISRTN